MPRCEGRPNEPCQRNDNTVRHTQGDMFLCPSCEDFRFPRKGPGRSGTSNTSAVMGTRSGSNSTNRSEQATVSAKSKGKAKKAKKNNQQPPVSSDTDSDGETHSTPCAGCLDTIDATCAKVTCAVCAGTFHFKCTGVQEKMRRHFFELFEQSGWVCEGCRSTAYSTIRKLQAEIAALTESVVDLRTQVTELKSQSSDATSALQSHEPPSPVANAAVTGQRSHSVVEIHRALNDINKRKRNVIVSGLAEEDNANDTVAFQQICEDYLHCKPFVVNCIRLGQCTQNKPRRLLIRLRDENTAAELLRSSRLLRTADDPVIARTVFINPDLTPAAAKLAFEERQQRRLKRATRSQRGSSTTTHKAVSYTHLTLPTIYSV